MTLTTNDKTAAMEAFQRLLIIMDELREKCPWDKKQTIETLRPLTIEELYELSDAILDEDPSEIRKELGDIMLHVVFYSRLATEQGWFSVQDMLNGICDKLIHRHPHIYGNASAETATEVKQNWEQLKLKEGNRSVLQGVPSSLPALVKATRIQDKVAGVGFDWENKEQVWAKVQEELKEFLEEVQKKDAYVAGDGKTHDDTSARFPSTDTKEENRKGTAENQKSSADPVANRIEEEFGDVLFSLINYARFLNINPENALEKTNRKFIKRFDFLEERARQEGIKLKPGMLEQMNEWWDEAKVASL